jgi:hypothetical protein
MCVVTISPSTLSHSPHPTGSNRSRKLGAGVQPRACRSRLPVRRLLQAGSGSAESQGQQGRGGSGGAGGECVWNLDPGAAANPAGAAATAAGCRCAYIAIVATCQCRMQVRPGILEPARAEGQATCNMQHTYATLKLAYKQNKQGT